MAKKSETRKRGRPKEVDPLSERVLVRLDAVLKKALADHARENGNLAEATAVRLILLDRFKADGRVK